MYTFNFVWKKGKEILTVADDFAQLRISVFREFPYLYDGSVEYEKEYIQTYSNAKDALLFAVYKNAQMIGATTCIPLKEETEEVKEPFIKAGFDVDTIFYFGESLILKEYRGLGFGHRFFDEREAHAKSFGRYNTTAFCAVNREDDHPLKPNDYRTNDAFWVKRGYQKSIDLICRMEWLDIQQSVPTYKELTFWTKEI
ncbi:MAG: hypothetical protein U0U67_10890 [Chitinophagales bacterium]